MANTVLPGDVRINDVIEIPSSGDFQRRDSRVTFGIVREIVPDPADPKTVKRLVVFEALPDDGKLRSRYQYVRLKNDNLPAYGLARNKPWSAVIDPVGVDIDPDKYYVRRTGHLRDDDEQSIFHKIRDMGGEEHLRLGGTGPTGYAQADWNKIVSGGYERRIPDQERPDDAPAKRKPRIQTRGADPNRDRVIDLPLVFATRVTDIAPGIVDALRAKGIESLRAAWEMTQQPEAFNSLMPKNAGALPALSIDDAIRAGYLPADTRGLGFVTDPIETTSTPVTTLNQLYDLSRDNGAGFDDYMGLRSKTAKARLELTATAQAAWSAYSVATPTTSDAAAQIRRAWGKLLTDYNASVRPHLDDADLSRMRAPENIPEKYIHDGKLVFTFAPRPR